MSIHDQPIYTSHIEVDIFEKQAKKVATQTLFSYLSKKYYK